MKTKYAKWYAWPFIHTAYISVIKEIVNAENLSIFAHRLNLCELSAILTYLITCCDSISFCVNMQSVDAIPYEHFFLTTLLYVCFLYVPRTHFICGHAVYLLFSFSTLRAVIKSSCFLHWNKNFNIREWSHRVWFACWSVYRKLGIHPFVITAIQKHVPHPSRIRYRACMQWVVTSGSGCYLKLLWMRFELTAIRLCKEIRPSHPKQLSHSLSLVQSLFASAISLLVINLPLNLYFFLMLLLWVCSVN